MPNAEEVAQDLLSGDAAADRAQGDQIRGSIPSVAHASRVAEWLAGGLLFRAPTTKSYSPRNSLTKGLPPVAERPLLVAKVLKAEGETSLASIMTRLNQDREGASTFTISSLTPTLKFLCDVELVEANYGHSGNGRGRRCTYKINALFSKTYPPQQLEFAVKEQWEKKQLAVEVKKQQAKKGSKCAIAKHVVLVRQASQLTHMRICFLTCLCC